MSDRNCKNCACYTEVTLSPMAPAQPQCRRNGPVPAQIKYERPLLDPKTKEVMIGKDLKPRTEAVVENVFLYAPTGPDKVCFDGWRPMETEPGENAQTEFIKRTLKVAMNAIDGKFSRRPLNPTEVLCTCLAPWDRMPGSHHSLKCPNFVADDLKTD